MKAKIAIFASGGGSNALKIIEYFNGHPTIEVVLICSNKGEAPIVGHARGLGLDVLVFNRAEFYQSDHVLKELTSHSVDYIVLAGFLWLIPFHILSEYQKRIINIHPALLPNYGGKGMYGDYVHRAVLAAGKRESGITIHVIDEEYDRGETLFQAKCTIEEGDGLAELKSKIQKLEHENFAPVIERYIQSNTSIPK